MATLKIGGIEASNVQEADIREKLGLINLLKLEPTGLKKDDVDLDAGDKEAVRENIDLNTALSVSSKSLNIDGVNLTPIQKTIVRAGIGTEALFTYLSKQPVKRFLKWGDSTTEAALTYIPYAWGETFIFDALPGINLLRNYGANGYTTTAILSAATGAVNGGGNVITPEGVGAECLVSNVDVLIISFGINDLRLNAEVATYGSVEMVAAVQALQTRLSTMVTRVRAIAPKVKVLFNVPPTLCLTGPLLTVNGQAVTDALRATYLGDEYIGILKISDIIELSDVCDSGGAVFGVVSPALAAKPIHMGDELHPTTPGYRQELQYTAAWLADPGGVDSYTTVAVGRIQTSASNYTDMSFIERPTPLFGDASGTTYGATRSPALGVGDEFLLTLASGVRRRMRILKKPYQNAAENYIRWANAQGIDGAFHEIDIPNGTSAVLRRKNITSVFSALAQRSGYQIYPIRVTAGGSGTVTIRGIPGNYDLINRAPTATDFLGLGPVGGASTVGVLGLTLAGATIAPTPSAAGSYDITLAGTNFTHAINQIGSILVPI